MKTTQLTRKIFAATIAGAALSAPFAAFAQGPSENGTNGQTGRGKGHKNERRMDAHKGQDHGGMERPVVVGKITAISGTTITVLQGTTVYAITIATAKITQLPPRPATPPSLVNGVRPTPPTPTVITLASLAVGDTVAVRGTVVGQSVTASEVTKGDFTQKGSDGMRGGNHSEKGGKGFGYGSVVSLTGNTLIVKRPNGINESITLQNTIQYKKVITGSPSDVVVGTNVRLHKNEKGEQVLVMGLPL